MSTLDNLRKSAKRWLKALRAGDLEAWERLRRTYSKAPARPGLRDIQQALARERGYAGWTVLKRALENQPTTSIEFTGGLTHAERVATFLEFACWDHHVHGRGDHRMHDRAAARLLEQHPEIARDSIYTAAVCGELEEVHRILAERPAAACESGGARGWTALLYLCYARFSYPPTIENALAIAGALLDHGANPNDYYMAGDSHYTALVGAAGEGEQDSPRQPQGPALFQLLLERGAEPFDVQVLYNTHFSGDMLWWLELVYAHTMKIGRTAEWADPDWKMLDMGAYGCGARFLLGIALRKRDLRLAEWLLAHGANPNAAPARDRRHSKRSLYEDAVRSGSPQMAELLARYGAITALSALSDQEQFQDACFRLEREQAGALLAKHPEYLKSPEVIFVAARQDRADVVEFLLNLGVPIEIEGEHKQRPLHEAAANNALRVARLLIDRGAEIDPVDATWGATPIGWAAHGDDTEMVDFLSQFSRNIWTLSFRGYVERLRQVLHDEPERAKAVTRDGITPLWWLPDDESKALTVVELFVAHGADPSIRSKAGKIAADWALKRGMHEVAQRLMSSEPKAAPRT